MYLIQAVQLHYCQRHYHLSFSPANLYTHCHINDLELFNLLPHYHSRIWGPVVIWILPTCHISDLELFNLYPTITIEATSCSDLGLYAIAR